MSVPKYRLDAIETIGRKILQEYDPALLDGPPQAVPIETIIETKFDLTLEYHCLRSELQRARAENTKANKEYESLKAEVLKAIQGKSALPQDVLTEMLEDTRQKVLSTSERITTLTAELNDGNSKIEEMKAEFNRIVSWSKIFDESPMEVKKMICGYIIKKVSVFRDYRVKIEFNINVEQFLNGIDSINECATYELPMAQ